MPVIFVYGIPDSMSQKLEEFTNTLISTVAYSVEEFELETSDVSVSYPRDLRPKGLGGELIIIVDGLLDKPERTENARNRLAYAIVQTTNQFFPETGLIECFIRTFSESQGFYSLRNDPKRKPLQFPEILELGGYSKEELIDVILAQGCTITPQALSLIDQAEFLLSTEKKTVKLCRKTVAEMGFKTIFTPWAEIRNWIEKNGQLCEHEVALRLIIIYQDQPFDEELYIANKFQLFRITNFNGKRSLLRNRVDGLRSDLILLENSPAKNETAVYCLGSEFVYCEK